MDSKERALMVAVELYYTILKSELTDEQYECISRSINCEPLMSIDEYILDQIGLEAFNDMKYEILQDIRCNKSTVLSNY